MAKNVIHIFGASGSGTSTLGKMLSEELGYTWMDTDNYFWEPTDPPFTKQREKAVRVQMIKEDIEKHENVVLSGALAGWGDVLIPYFTLVVRVVIDPQIRLARLKNREYERFGERIMPGGDMYEHHLEFMDWASKYDTAGPNMRSKAKHDGWQKALNCPLFIVDGAAELKTNVEKVIEKIAR